MRVTCTNLRNITKELAPFCAIVVPFLTEIQMVRTLGGSYGNPDQLAQDAQQTGLISSDAIENLLRERLRKQRVDEPFSAMDRMAAANEPAAMSPDELAAELAAIRATFRSVSNSRLYCDALSV